MVGGGAERFVKGVAAHGDEDLIRYESEIKIGVVGD